MGEFTIMETQKPNNVMLTERDKYHEKLMVNILKKDTDTVSRYIVNYHVPNTNIDDSLKIEISYRTPAPAEQITIKDGIRFSSVERIIDNKLHAAYDGDNTRTKGRDLFDLHFLEANIPNTSI